MRLYLQVIKFYIPELGDYCAEFPEVYEDSTEDTTDIRKLPTNIYFFDYMFPMMYCAKCYPDIPEAIAAMDAYQTYTPEFQKEKGSDHSNYYAERHKILTDLKSQKELKKNEFSLFLKQISIMSEFDWTLHLFSDKHNMKDCVKPVAEEVKDVKTVLEVVKNEILGLSSVMTGQVAVSNMVSAFLKDEKIAKFGKNTANVVSFVSEKSEQTGRTQLEDIISEIVKTRLKVFKKQCQNQETESLTTSAASAIGDMIDERLFARIKGVEAEEEEEEESDERYTVEEMVGDKLTHFANKYIQDLTEFCFTEITRPDASVSTECEKLFQPLFHRLLDTHLDKKLEPILETLEEIKTAIGVPPKND